MNFFNENISTYKCIQGLLNVSFKILFLNNKDLLYFTVGDNYSPFSPTVWKIGKKIGTRGTPFDFLIGRYKYVLERNVSSKIISWGI